MPPFVLSSSDDKSIRCGHYENATVDDAKDFFFKCSFFPPSKQTYSSDHSLGYVNMNGINQSTETSLAIGFVQFYFRF